MKVVLITWRRRRQVQSWVRVQVTGLGIVLVALSSGCTTDTQPTVNKPTSRSVTVVSGQDQAHQQDAIGAAAPDDSDGDIDVGGYTEKEMTASTTEPNPSGATSTQTSTSTGTSTTPPAKGTDASERHDGQITFQSRLQAFKLTVSSMVTGKTVATKEYSLAKSDSKSLSVPGLCVTGAKTCLVVTLSGGMTQTAGKSACAKAVVKGPTKVFINADVDGAGALGSCFDDPTDIEDAFTISCPNSTEMVMGTCASGL